MLDGGTGTDNRAWGLALANELSTVPFRGGLLVRVRGDLEPAVQRELLQDVMHVTFHGVRRDVEPLRDFLVAQTLGDEIGVLLLASFEINPFAPRLMKSMTSSSSGWTSIMMMRA